MMMSKGSKRRPEKGTQYQDNWEKIFNKKKRKKDANKDKQIAKGLETDKQEGSTTHYYARCTSTKS